MIVWWDDRTFDNAAIVNMKGNAVYANLSQYKHPKQTPALQTTTKMTDGSDLIAVFYCGDCGVCVCVRLNLFKCVQCV